MHIDIKQNHYKYQCCSFGFFTPLCLSRVVRLKKSYVNCLMLLNEITRTGEDGPGR